MKIWISEALKIWRSENLKVKRSDSLFQPTFLLRISCILPHLPLIPLITHTHTHPRIDKRQYFSTSNFWAPSPDENINLFVRRNQIWSTYPKCHTRRGMKITEEAWKKEASSSFCFDLRLEPEWLCDGHGRLLNAWCVLALITHKQPACLTQSKIYSNIYTNIFQNLHKYV